MIIILTNARDVTADFFEVSLRASNIAYARINTESLATLPLNFEAGGSRDRVDPAAWFALDGSSVNFNSISAIYYRRPEAPNFPSATPPAVRDWMENEVRRAWGGILNAYPSIRWINHPLAISAASYKPEQLRRAARTGFDVPETLITSDPDEARAFCERLGWSVIAKPIGHGEVLGLDEADDRIVYTSRVRVDHADKLERVTRCPTLFQHAIRKDIDLRVTVIGEDVFPIALHSQEREVSEVDCRRDNMTGMRYSSVILPEALTDSIRRLVASYGLTFAALDFVRDTFGRYWFLELNPAGQWAWLEQETGVPIASSLARALVGTP